MIGRRTLTVLVMFAFFTGIGTAASFAVVGQSDWDAGSFTDTESVNGILQVVDGASTGTYTSEVFDAGDNYTWNQLLTSYSLNGDSASVTVETSRDDFSTVHQRDTLDLSAGSPQDLSLNESRYVRFNYTLEGDAEISSTNVSIGDQYSFIIRGDGCQTDELEMFSMSGRTNAHAGDPGYWSNSVCASGLDQRHFTSVCASAETPIMSFFGTEQTTTHLSTDPGLFSYKLCTETLTLGVRDQCPDTTKAIVSIYEEDEDHIAEPDEYPKQLCGAFFDSVTAMLKFHYGPNTTIRMNDTEDPDPGIYRDTSGRESWYIAAENLSLVTGIVSGEDTLTTAVGYNDEGGETTFNLTQERGEAGYLIPFAQGEADDIRDRIPLIVAGNFIDQINPNFGFALAEELTVRLSMQLQDIELLSDFRLSAGSYTLSIENFGETDSGTPQVAINVTE